jgi:NADH dehydrogenase
MENIYAIGDCSIMEGDPEYPMGHPQLAQVALQQADLVSKNIRLLENGEQPKMFHYKNLGCMATIGRRKAVVEIGKFKFGGFFAWILWLVVHIRSILGIKNKASVFINWMWNYINYTQSLRLILKIGK